MSQRQSIPSPLSELLASLKPQSLQLLNDSEISELRSLARAVEAIPKPASLQHLSVVPAPVSRVLPFNARQTASPLERLRVFRPRVAAVIDGLIDRYLAEMVPPDER